MNPYQTTHGHSIRGKRSPEYAAWNDMKNRCTNPNVKQYKDYGGRGIKVCERWQNFENFLEDMGSKPEPKLTLQRVNNDGDYEPGNCKWATWKEQVSNRRNLWIARKANPENKLPYYRAA